VASPDQLVSGSIGDKSVIISYGSPRKRGRDILGTVVPYDKIWRTGANARRRWSRSRTTGIGKRSHPRRHLLGVDTSRHALAFS
jgi:hypothetical protein